MTDFGALKGSFLHHRVDVVPISSTVLAKHFKETLKPGPANPFVNG